VHNKLNLGIHTDYGHKECPHKNMHKSLLNCERHKVRPVWPLKLPK